MKNARTAGRTFYGSSWTEKMEEEVHYLLELPGNNRNLTARKN
jgi:hypothetical protein